MKRVSLPASPTSTRAMMRSTRTPALGGIVELHKAPQLAAIGHRLEALGGGFLQCLDMAPQRHIRGEAQHPIHLVLAAPIEDFRAGVMAVRAQQDLDLGPMGADRADEAAQKGADLVPAWP